MKNSEKIHDFIMSNEEIAEEMLSHMDRDAKFEQELSVLLEKYEYGKDLNINTSLLAYLTTMHMHLIIEHNNIIDYSKKRHDVIT